MSLKNALILSTVLLSSIAGAQNYPQNDFRSPLDIPIILSGSYGELRSNHFHAGIDIKTNGVEGLTVRAAAEGEVARIAVSPYGYGNALYIRHPNGYTTVYAHLQKFNPTIAAWVEEQQYDRESFAVNLFPPPGTFRVESGEIIALSGNSGGSGGPHLHFEVRDSRTEEPINPLLFGFVVPDHRAPEIRGVYAYALDEKSHVNQRQTRTSLSMRTIREGVYAVRWPQKGVGQLGFAIDVIDRFDGAWNANGPYTISQYVNDVKNYEYVMERFAFSETRFLNGHIDYDLYDCCRKRANRMWVLPGNNLRAYRDLHNSGIVTVWPDSTYELKWVLTDVAGNTSTLTGTISGEAMTASPEKPEGLLLSYDQPNFGRVEEMQWNMNANILYDDVVIQTGTSESISGGYGPTYQLGATGIPCHAHYTVTLPLTDVPNKYMDKAVIVSLNNDRTSPDSWDGKVIYSTNTPHIQASVRTMGWFTVMVDSVAPSLRFRSPSRDGTTLTSGDAVTLTMTDDLSGIASYRCEVDGQWHLMSYDAKYSALRVELNDRITPGEHRLTITAVDDRGNTSTVNRTFYFRP